MAKPDDDAAIRAQYEGYPYPARDPEDERKRLISGSPSHVLEIEHYVFAGRRAGALNALVAGGGTGDGAIMLAQHLAERGRGRVTYVDMSTASMDIARRRAEVRGLANIAFHHGSLLDVGDIAPGPYDYIDCCGVLHHLADPAAGLKALVSVLKPDGGLGLMVYGELGRTGVYPLQRALSRLSGDDADPERLALARQVLADLPEGNWFRRNPYVQDHLKGGDAGLYDLLLHRRDRAYTVGQVAELVAGAGLRITGFLPPAQYDPAHYLDDDALKARAAALPFLDRAALAEELSGAMKTHAFYAVRADNAVGGAADPADPAMVPVLRDRPAKELAAGLARSRHLTAELGGRKVLLPVPDGAAEIVGLCDGRRNLKQIHGKLRADGQAGDWPTFQARFLAVFRLLHPLHMLLLAGRK
jgi:SAM-dependent methyltransferase